MNVLVIGANGQIGRMLVEQLAQEGKHQVTAMIRKPEQADALKQLGANVVMGDLEGSVNDLAEVMKDHDAVVFTAGSGGSTGADKTLLIDLDGAVKQWRPHCSRAFPDIFWSVLWCRSAGEMVGRH